MRRDDAIDALAELVVTLGANVQPGQVVALASEPGKEPLTRAIADAAYRRGALFVDLAVFDVHLKRSRALHADPDTLAYVPPWYGDRVLALGEHGAARIALTGPVAPHIMRDVDPARLGRDMLPAVKEGRELLNARSTNWTVAPCPTQAWAELVHPELDPQDALDRLWDEIAHVCRLDEPDPAQAWRRRLDDLVAVAGKLTSLHLDALRFDGPGTELTVGLLERGEWICGGAMETAAGVPHVPNIPTEEVFTTPDPERVDGQVTSTKPLVVSGNVIEGLRASFEGGRAVAIEADEGAGTLRALSERDAGAARLGEVALVDRAGRIGPLGTVFYDTLLDENAASHLALGQGFEFAVGAEERERVNASEIHVDFMIGSDELAVTGIRRDGSEVALLRAGSWQI